MVNNIVQYWRFYTMAVYCVVPVYIVHTLHVFVCPTGQHTCMYIMNIVTKIYKIEQVDLLPFDNESRTGFSGWQGLTGSQMCSDTTATACSQWCSGMTLQLHAVSGAVARHCSCMQSVVQWHDTAAAACGVVARHCSCSLRCSGNSCLYTDALSRYQQRAEWWWRVTTEDVSIVLLDFVCFIITLQVG